MNRVIFLSAYGRMVAPVPGQTPSSEILKLLIETVHRRVRKGLATGLAVALGLIVAACAPREAKGPEPVAQAMSAGGMSDISLTKLSAGMDPAMLTLAVRHDPGLRRTDFWNRPEGWESLDIRKIPDLGIETSEGATAEELNSYRPFSKLPIRPMRPFVLNTDADDAARAQRCLSQAVYYESAREPRLGQEAVAQVVLNRVRHPAYPKSVCGVVYQGAARATGCQFTFTCDGSLRWAPEPGLWAQAQAVAKRALAGHVAKNVGSATHYHASYVAPYWAPTLVKMAQVGAHIFYRWTGPWGEPPAFTGRYAGREAYLTQAILGGLDARTQGGDGLFAPEDEGLNGERKITLAVAGEVRTYTVTDPAATGGERTRVLGTLHPSRRQPTAEEIKRINDSLSAMDGEPAPKAKAAPDKVSSAGPAGPSAGAS